jgi:hypothetical protein
MKAKLVLISLLAVVIGFGSCGGKKNPSKECNIDSFTVKGVEYEISGNNDITYFYPKTGEDNWGNKAIAPGEPVTPEIKISNKASISPSGAEAQKFLDGPVTYTVTAEDGVTKKVYKVTVSRQLYL